MTHRVSRRSFAGTTLGGMLAGGGTFARPDRTTPIQVGSSKQVFVGDDLIESSKGVRLTVNRPRKTGEQLIVSEHPWEEHRVGGANTILYDEGVYKLWYDCMSSDSRFQCYATSSDGLKWDKPSLGVVEYRGSRANNIVFQTATCSVFIDPRAPSEARYKALIQHKVRDVPLGYPWLLASPDGLRWRPFVERAVMEDRFFTDTPIVLFWDQRIGKYVTYGRAWDPVWPTGLRKVARAETDDVSRWPKPTIVLGRDAEDPENAHFYNPAAMQYPYAANLYLLFPSVYYPIQGDGPLDVQVALSRDGVRWLRPCRTPFLPIGVKGTYDAGAIYVTPGLIRHGDELSIYYSAFDFKHGSYNQKTDRKKGSISRAVIRLDGFVSADFSYQSGELTTVPLRFRGGRLELNIDTGAGGIARIGLCDADGRFFAGHSKEDCDPVRTNSVAQTVTWRGSADLTALQDKPVKLAFEMRDASLFAFQFQT